MAASKFLSGNSRNSDDGGRDDGSNRSDDGSRSDGGGRTKLRLGPCYWPRLSQ